MTNSVYVLIIKRLQEHEQPDLSCLHLRRAVRCVRERGLARLPLEDHPCGAGLSGHGHRHEAQDVVHLLLQGRVRCRAMAAHAVPAGR
jgi:hypothetical protein